MSTDLENIKLPSRFQINERVDTPDGPGRVLSITFSMTSVSYEVDTDHRAVRYYPSELVNPLAIKPMFWVIK